MHSTFAVGTFLTLGVALAAEKPRVFITESQALNVTNDAAAGDSKSALSLTGGNTPQSLDVIKSFTQRCPEVLVTGDREKADYLVRLDHEAVNPTTPFLRGNKVAVFDKSSDLVYSSSARILGNVVKGACAAILGHSRR